MHLHGVAGLFCHLDLDMRLLYFFPVTASSSFPNLQWHVRQSSGLSSLWGIKRPVWAHSKAHLISFPPPPPPWLKHDLWLRTLALVCACMRVCMYVCVCLHTRIGNLLLHVSHLLVLPPLESRRKAGLRKWTKCFSSLGVGLHFLLIFSLDCLY